VATRFFALATRVNGAADLLVRHVSARLEGFHEAYSSRNLKVLVNPPGDCLGSAGVGAIIGTAFERQGTFSRVRKLSAEMVDRLRSSTGQNLIDEHWGGYVAILDFHNERALHVVRDPSGALPCLFVHIGAVTIVASDVETLRDAGCLETTVDWEAISRYLFAPDLKTTRTALAGCRELLPGQRLNLTFSGTYIDAVWSPWDHVTSSADQTYSVVAERLRGTIDLCIKAWASCFSNILLGVSGGLDSSVIATCLADQTIPWSALTMRTHAPDGDERLYAQLLTDSLKVPLIERFHEIDDIDVTRPSSAHLPRPFGLTFGQSQDQAKMKLAEDLGFDAFFTGQGGDNVFCYMQSATPLVDRLRAEGLSAGTVATLLDISHLTETSLWDVAASALDRMRGRDRAYHWPVSPGLLNPDLARQFAGTLSHNWLAVPKNAQIGKAAHIAKLLRIQNTVDSFSRTKYGPLVTPLLAQPIVELCLSIPTWMWCRGGINRAPVRQAFADRLPPSLLARKSKAGPMSFAFEVIEKNRARLRDFLLEGELSSRAIIDRQTVERLLDGDTLLRPPAHFDIMLATEAEAWARHWSTRFTKSEKTYLPEALEQLPFPE
jgi:asparagine synthase (glutamine-hydrolysing)